MLSSVRTTRSAYSLLLGSCCERSEAAGSAATAAATTQANAVQYALSL
jgi:hypothetical protein